MSIRDKRTITLLVEQRLEIDDVDSMSKIIIHQTVPVEIDLDRTLDKIRELLAQAQQDPFTFL